MPGETPKTNSAISKLESAIQGYTDALTKLEDTSWPGSIPFWQIYLFMWAVESQSYSLMRYVSSKVGCSRSPSKETVLEVLTARDTVQAELSNQSNIPIGSLIKLNDLDNRLKKETNKITTVVDLTEWHSILNPKVEAWWWFFKPPKHRWDYLDWLWKILTVVFLTSSLSLTVDISSRFLSGGPDTLGAFVTATQSVLTLLAGRSALTKAGQDSIKRALTRLNIPKYLWEEVSCGIAFSLLLVSVTFRLSLPEIAIFYKNLGDRYTFDNDTPQLSVAISSYKRALLLNPDYVEPHYKLGVVYEKIQDNEKAIAQYKIAVQDDFDSAYNNLGRMYILNKKYYQASSLLLTGLILNENDEVRYYLLKNLGWARLKQNRYAEAKRHLQDAINLDNKKAPAYCLLAQVLEEAGDNNTAIIMNNWRYCLGYSSRYNIDEDKWIDQARQRLETGLTKQLPNKK
ncbi:tetratricopeptide repeat protein [Moorena sp. SIO3I8]|uniref:tetratricopeptide repeat protein n=1 Tax=Moorena sp. SIO3I8 TaxID=2607833 RepID=UPI0013C27566|nr:tetratricopeptide repeat protein [Moorena sp. SIO3I8]NEO05622.1 tetratricopeptide repeat protein [Moorena sp. SIO3I8]